MLSIFRRGITSKIMLGVLALGLFAIVITGFGSGTGMEALGGGGNRIATVEGEPVTQEELTTQVNRQLEAARQQQPELDMGTFLRSGVLGRIVEQLIAVKAQIVFAMNGGLTVSDEMINREIANIPEFRNFAGQFDPATYRSALARQRMTEAQFRGEIRDSLIQRQLLLPVAGSARIPEGVAMQYASLLLERRRGTIGVVPTQAMGPGQEPTDAEVAAFYRENQSRYTIPEQRVIRYAAFGTDRVAQAAAPTEAEITAFYQQNAATYAGSETRTLSQVVLPDQRTAQTFAQRLASGTSFADAARQAGFSAADISIGEQTRQAFAEATSPQVAAAAFGAQRGATTQPIRTPLGWHIVRVDGITTTPGRPLAAVRGEIEQQVRTRKTQEALIDLSNRIEDALANGATFDEIVRSERLTAQQTQPITATGASTQQGYRPPPEVGPLLGTAFDLAAEDDPMIEAIQPNERFALVDVVQVIPAAPAPLQQIAARVKADLATRRASQRARAVATSIMAKINAGMEPRQAFAEADLRLPPVQPVSAVRREIAGQSGRVPPPLMTLFSMAEGRARLLEAPNGAGWFVIHLDEVTPGNAAADRQLVQATRSEFARIAGEEYAEQFARAVLVEMEVERDEEAINRVRSQLQGGQAQ